MKSAGHIKHFFERTDRGLSIARALSGVQGDFIALRRRLRDQTSLPAPPARPPFRSCCSSADCRPARVEARGSEQLPQMSEAKVAKKKCCSVCRGRGHGEWRLYRRGNSKSSGGIRLLCTNPLCEKYQERPSRGPASTEPPLGECAKAKCSESRQKRPDQQSRYFFKPTR